MKKTIILNCKELSELLCYGENPKATAIWILLTDKQKEEFIDYQYEVFTDFSECGNWEDGIPPTREHVKHETLYLLEGKN